MYLMNGIAKYYLVYECNHKYILFVISINGFGNQYWLYFLFYIYDICNLYALFSMLCNFIKNKRY